MMSMGLLATFREGSWGVELGDFTKWHGVVSTDPWMPAFAGMTWVGRRVKAIAR